MRIFLFILFLSFFSCSFSEKNSKFAKIKFDKLIFDFGTIKVKDSVDCNFNFENKGNSILNVNKVKPSCNCTVPEWTKESVEKNKGGIIKVKYSSSYPKVVSESISVYYNGENSPIILTISGEVVY